MTWKKNKRLWVRVLSFTTAFLLIIGGYLLTMRHQLNHLERQLSHHYQASLEELSSSIDSMAITLVKSLYASTPAGLSTLTNELVLQAGAAETALSALPIKQQGVSAVAKFLSQVSDYSLVLTRNVVNGENITQEERTSLEKLAKVASDLSVRLEEARILYNDSSNWNESISSALHGAETVSGLNTAMTEIEQSLSDYPTLIYDGPFSDHISTRKSQLLSDKNEVSLNQAKTIAAAKLSVHENELAHSGDEEGNMPAYVFKSANGSIAVTKSGGYTTYFRKTRDISDSQMNYETAVEKAKEYIKKCELGNFSETYYFTDEGICVVNFAAMQQDTICYPDLIKIGVALDNGEIMFYEARGFLMNHAKRQLSEPPHSAASAKQLVNPHLKIERTRLSIIPSGGEQERYCYEFLCRGDKDEELLVYINAETLVEEQILLLLKTDGGTLTK